MLLSQNESPTRRPGTWVTTARFRLWYRYQRHSPNLVVYCRETRSVVTIAWPLSSRGRRIGPYFIFRWLFDRGLTWYCFCQHLFPRSWEMTCQIGQNIDGGGPGVYCHFSPSRCGFAMDLMRLYTEATLESEYIHLHPSIDNPLPHYEHLLQAFLGQHQGFVPEPDSELARNDVEGRPPTGAYFQGFCGTLFGDAPQIRATEETHSFQRQLRIERRLIRQRRERHSLVHDLYHNRPVGMPAQWDVLDEAGITSQDIDDFLHA